MVKQLKILLYADSYGGRVGTSEQYAQYVAQFGEVILITPNNDLDFFAEIADVLVLPGGADVDPNRYGERPIWATGRANPHYEYLDTTLLPLWIKTGKPIIGICRGMQTLNVALGGNLVQHLIGHIGGEDRSKLNHPIYTEIKDSKGELKYPLYFTNSYHHQAVGKLGEGLEVIGWGEVYDHCPSLHNKKKLLTKKYWEKLGKSGMGWSHTPYFAVPEIIRHTTKPYLGIQYHPEEFNCDLANELISDMLMKAYPDRFTGLESPAFRELSENYLIM